MKMLLLGGTAFLGRAIATTALDRGVQVTCVARGTGPAPDGATLVRADRDHDDALYPVSDVTWDVVVDLTRQPGHARRAVRDLTARHWIYVSSSSVYSRFDTLEQSETAGVCAPLAREVMGDMSQYGPAKVACEETYRTHSPHHTIVRSGLIGGHGDWSGRTGYYPWRFAHPTGPEVFVPDNTFPVALIDVADLASWLVDCAEKHPTGTFNATGPTTTLGEVYSISRALTASPASPRVVDDAHLIEAGVASWMGPKSLPMWIDDPAWRYFATLDTAAAQDHGLRTRPLRETLAAVLAYEETRTEPRPAGLTDDQERQLRALLA
jgi:2'-hydroxyisoflavone reductase